MISTDEANTDLSLLLKICPRNPFDYIVIYIDHFWLFLVIFDHLVQYRNNLYHGEEWENTIYQHEGREPLGQGDDKSVNRSKIVLSYYSPSHDIIILFWDVYWNYRLRLLTFVLTYS